MRDHRRGCGRRASGACAQRDARSSRIGHAPAVPLLEVLPTSLPPMACALSDFAEAIGSVAEVPAVGGALQEALSQFARSWSDALGVVGDSAIACAADVVRAADAYTRLDDLLVPDGLQ